MSVIYHQMAPFKEAPLQLQKMRIKLFNMREPPEIWMENALRSHGVAFESQVLITMELEGILRPMFLDFFIPNNNVAIEIDGSQHRLPNNQIADQYKNDWCHFHGIPLIRIQSHILKRGNILEMGQWAIKLSNPEFRPKWMQNGSGFGLPIS